MFVQTHWELSINRDHEHGEDLLQHRRHVHIHTHQYTYTHTSHHPDPPGSSFKSKFDLLRGKYSKMLENLNHDASQRLS